VRSVKASAAYQHARRSWYALLEQRPAAYSAYQRRRQRSVTVVDRQTDLVIEGRPGCANSFAREAILLVNPQLRVASHLHSPAQVLEGLRLGKPVVVLIRRPSDAIVSEASRFDDIDLRDELNSFVRFYDRLLPRAEETVVATFERVTSRFGDVVKAVNAHFGTSFESFPDDDPSSRERVFAKLVEYNRAVGIGEGRAAVPGQARDERAAQVRSMLADPELATLMGRAEEIYLRFTAFER
jgi:hypothetical protein